ncbi:MAG: 50S ribosomal protein L33 [Candidatus Saccharimonadales bacterium]
MAKKNQKRKTVRLVSESGAAYYTKRRNDGEKLALRKFDPKTRQHVTFTESGKNLGRNEVKKRK